MIPGNANPLLLASAAEAAAAGPIKSLRFNSGDSAYLARTPSSAGNRKTWTFSCWVKRSKLGSYQSIFAADVDSNNKTNFYFDNSDRLVYFQYTSGAYAGRKISTRVFRDCSSWYHLVLNWDSSNSTASDRIAIYVNNVRLADFDTSVDGTDNAETTINSTVEHQIGGDAGANNWYADLLVCDPHFIDGSALDATSFGAYDDNGVWQAAAYSGTFGTNGFHLLDFENESTIGHDSSGNNNDFTANNLRSANASGGAPTVTGTGPGFPAESTAIANLWDGQVSSYPGDFLTAADGGVITISWPTAIQNVTSIQYYSFNGSDRHNVNEGGWSGNSGSGAGYKSAYSGSAINLTKLQLQKNDQASFVKIGAIKINGTILTTSNYQSDSDTLDIYFDVPTNGTQSDTGAGGEVSGCYATFNPLNGSTYTFSNGNLEATGYGATKQMTSTFGVSSGKWYAEFTVSGSGGTSNCGIGISKGEEGYYPGQQSGSAGYFGSGSKIVGGAVSSYGASFTYGDIIGVALDMDAGTCTMYKNNSSQGQIISSLSGTYFIAIRNSSSSGDKIIANFGARSFAYTAPSGYKAWNTASLPTPTIADGSDYFDVKLWTGTGSQGGSDQTITGYSFAPQFAWIKNRGATEHHALFDQIRGATKVLYSSLTHAEATQTNGLKSFTSDGFELGIDGKVNGNNQAIVGWAWNAGSSTASNTDGSITSSVRANQTAGFSIVSWTGTGSAGTIGHGLNSAPELIIGKNAGNTTSWIVGAAAANDWSKVLLLNSTAALATNGNFNSTAPTSSVFSVGTGSGLNQNTKAHIAYCFAPVANFSAMGSYEANGSADGPFVSTSFRPALVICKSIDQAQPWQIFDSARGPINVITKGLQANSSGAEYDTTARIDFLSNGFKIRAGGGSEPNVSGNTYIYYAVAENPFQANGGLAR